VLLSRKEVQVGQRQALDTHRLGGQQRHRQARRHQPAVISDADGRAQAHLALQVGVDQRQVGRVPHM
jgi:hypothetical protein